MLYIKLPYLLLIIKVKSNHVIEKSSGIGMKNQTITKQTYQTIIYDARPLYDSVPCYRNKSGRWKIEGMNYPPR